MPMQQTTTNQTVPQIFAAIHLESMPTNMTSAIITGLITQILTAFLVTWLLCKTKGLTYWGRVRFTLVFALAAAILSEIPYWNWFGFSLSFTLVQIADVIIAWFFAALAMAKVVENS
jgi:methylmalonyl-CoA mutase N-terminal domain/subunit